MKIHVVTPSFNQVGFLKKLVASVSDQATEQVLVHHHVQDGGSTDGSVEWLERYAQEVGVEPEEGGTQEPSTQYQAPGTSHYSFSYASEPDKGMYDAINRGWMRGIEQQRTEDGGQRTETGGQQSAVSSQRSEDLPSSGQCSTPGAQCLNGETILAHLNCDEQYLPGGLEKVSACFAAHPEADVVLADMIVTDKDGGYVCHRRSLRPNATLSRICCIGMTTTTFQRASVVRDRQVLFDTSWRNIGDMVWYNALHKAGVRFAVCNELVSVFSDTGDNLNLTEEAIRERKRYAKEYLWGLRWPTRMMSKMYSLRRYLKDFWLTAPSQYELYWSDLDRREIREIKNPTPLWHRKGPSLRSSAGKE